MDALNTLMTGVANLLRPWENCGGSAGECSTTYSLAALKFFGALIAVGTVAKGINTFFRNEALHEVERLTIRDHERELITAYEAQNLYAHHDARKFHAMTLSIGLFASALLIFKALAAATALLPTAAALAAIWVCVGAAYRAYQLTHSTHQPPKGLFAHQLG